MRLADPGQQPDQPAAAKNADSDAPQQNDGLAALLPGGLAVEDKFPQQADRGILGFDTASTCGQNLECPPLIPYIAADGGANASGLRDRTSQRERLYRSEAVRQADQRVLRVTTSRCNFAWRVSGGFHTEVAHSHSNGRRACANL